MCLHALWEKHYHAIADMSLCPPPCAQLHPKQPCRGRGGRSLAQVPEMLLCTYVPLAASLGSPFLTCPAPGETVPVPAASLLAKLRQLQASRQRVMRFPKLCPVMVCGNAASSGAQPSPVPVLSLCFRARVSWALRALSFEQQS